MIVFLLFVPGIFGALGVESIANPISQMLNTIFAFLPNILGAAIILIVGILVARLVRSLLIPLFAKIKVDKLQEKFGIKEFKQTREELIKTLGEPVSFRYLTKLEFVSVEPHIWKVRFERESRKGEKIHSETLFRIITGRTDDGTILIIGFNFL